MASKMAAFLFCDVVGSTALQTRLGDDAADPVRRSLFGLLSEAVVARRGEEVKNLGDGIMAAFASAADALDCAIAMQQGIVRLGTDLGLELSLRVGVSAGEASREQGDWFGTPVIEAARLCGRAESGQILVSEMARGLASPRRRHAFRPHGPVELKGLPGPLVVHEAGWESVPEEPTGASASGTPPRSEVPLPDRLRTSPPIGFFGRKREREVLTAAWKEAVAGERRMVFLSGEPGIGKTSLASELARTVHAEGALVLYGRCDEDLGVPYLPFVEALRGDALAGARGGLTGWAQTNGAALIRLVPEFGPLFPDVPPDRSIDPETDRYRLFQSVSTLLAAVSRSQPVLLVLDDLHWAAKPTLLLLKHLVASGDSMRLLVLGAFREAEVSRSHPLSDLLADLRRQPSVERLPLVGLSDDEVVALVERANGQALDDEGVALAHAVRQESDGNPFFVAEILRHLVESRAVVQDGGRWVSTARLAEVGLPASVREVIGHRVQRLGPEASHVLALAAVIGRDFDLDLLALVAEQTEDRLLDLLEEGAAAGLVQEAPRRPGRFTFAHALVQHALYEELGGLRRGRTHQRVAAALEVLCGEDPGERVPELAHHWLAATRPVQSAKALDYALRAGDRALDQLAPEEAVTWYSQALELHEASGGDDAQRAELLVRLGEAQRRAAQPVFRETLLDAARLARDLGDTDRLVRAVLANNRGVMSEAAVIDWERVETLEAALTSLGAVDSPARARLLATLAAELTSAGDWPRRLALADEALRVARQTADDATLCRVLNLRNITLEVPETVAGRLGDSAEALELSARLGDPLERFWALTFRLHTAAEAGALEEIDGLLAEMDALAGRLGQPGLGWFVAFHRAWRELMAGRITESDRLTLEAFQIGNDSGQPDALRVFAAQLWAVRLHQGRLAELVPLLDQGVADNPDAPVFRAFLAYTYAELGDVNAASELLATDAADGFDLTYDPTWAMTLACYAEVSSVVANGSAAAVLADKLRPLSGLLVFAAVTNLGAVDRYLGLLATASGHFEKAEAYFSAAAQFHARIDAPIWLARTHLDWGRLLVARGRPGDNDLARSLLEDAAATARDLGCAAVADRAERSLDVIAR